MHALLAIHSKVRSADRQGLVAKKFPFTDMILQSLTGGVAGEDGLGCVSPLYPNQRTCYCDVHTQASSPWK